MSVRGTGSFDNDDAVEWAAAYREMGLGIAASTMAVAIEDAANNRLSLGIAARAVAAAEAVAFVLGRGSAEGQRLFRDGPVEDTAKAEALVPQAEDVLNAIANTSELSGYWKNAGEAEHAAFLASLNDLRGRLGLSGDAEAPAPAAPAATAAPAPVSAPAAPGGDLADAVRALAREVEALRRDMADGFARIEGRLEGMGR